MENNSGLALTQSMEMFRKECQVKITQGTVKDKPVCHFLMRQWQDFGKVL